MKKISKIGLIINFNKQKPIQLGKEIIEWLEKKKIQVLAPEEDARFLGINAKSHKEFCQESDVILVLGGDGTF